MRQSLLRWLFLLAVAALVVGALLIGGAIYLKTWAVRSLHMLSPSVEVTVPPGASFGYVIQVLRSAGVGIEEIPAKLLARQRGDEGRIKAGVYSVRAPITPERLLNMLSRGDVVQLEVVIPEGWTFRQMRARISGIAGLRHDSASLSDTELLRAIGAEVVHPEGWFFPDTYRVDKGASDLTVFRRAHQALNAALGAAWSARAPNSPLRSPYEALVLASIIEKETGRSDDRPLIGSVFVNRLRLGMRLQTDPTVIYGIGPSFDGNLRRADLLRDTPYNTYTRFGLPPTPIALPGRDSILAAVRPAESRALYFVARGDGSSVFSDNLDSHNRAVDRYQRGARRPQKG